MNGFGRERSRGSIRQTHAEAGECGELERQGVGSGDQRAGHQRGGRQLEGSNECSQGLTEHGAAVGFYPTDDEKSQEDFKQGIMGSVLCFQTMALVLRRQARVETGCCDRPGGEVRGLGKSGAHNRPFPL